MATSSLSPSSMDSSLEPIVKSNKTLAFGLVFGGVLALLFASWLRNDQFESAPTLAIVVTTIIGALFAATGIWHGIATPGNARSSNGQAILSRQRLLGFFLLAAGVLLLILSVQLGFSLRLRGFGQSVGLGLFSLVPIAAGVYCLQPFHDPATSPGVRNLTEFSQLFLPVLGLIGGACLVSFVYLAFFRKIGQDWFPELGALILESFLCLACIFWFILTNPTERTSFSLRVLILIWGGLTGLIVAGMALLRAFLWRQQVFLGGIATWQGDEGWKFWLCAYLALVGLVLMFGSLLLARTDVRSQPVLRQVLYGYNSVVTGLLLLAVLGIFNVVAYAMFPMTLEWSKVTGLTSLSPYSKNAVAALKQPTKVHVLMSEHHFVFKDLQALLGNMQTQSDKLQVAYQSPDTYQREYIAMAERYPEIAASLRDFDRDADAGRGILIVYGQQSEDEKDRAPHVFIPQKKLYEPIQGDPHSGRKPSLQFKGEVELVRELNFLAQGQKKHKLYFLQGHGELNIAKNDRFDRRPLKQDMSDFGAGALVDKLKKDNYEVKGLSFDAPDKDAKDPKDAKSDILYVQPSGKDKLKEVPADAFAVIILGPSHELSKETLDALDRYMARGGKMVATLEIVLDRGGDALKKSNLPEFLKTYGVDATDDFVMRQLRHQRDDPLFLFCFAAESGNVVAQQFRDLIIPLDTVRVVRPGPSVKGDYKATPLIEVRAPDRSFPQFWKESNVKALKNPITFMRDLASEGLLKPGKEPLPVAVTVEARGKPRMVVFGDTEFLWDHSLERMRGANEYYSLFVSSLAWMAERDQAAGGPQPRETSMFVLPVNVNENRLVVLPGLLMILATVGLGTGIWIVRRR